MTRTTSRAGGWRAQALGRLLASCLCVILSLPTLSGQDQPAAPTAPAAPGTSPASSVVVARAWARATTSDALSGASYCELRNPTAHGQDLLGASAVGCDHCELHVHRTDAQGVMHMSQVDHLEIPAGGTLLLQPGAIHLMLLGLTHGLGQGQSVRVVLHLSDGTVTLAVPVLAAGAMGPDG